MLKLFRVVLSAILLLGLYVFPAQANESKTDNSRSITFVWSLLMGKAGAMLVSGLLISMGGMFEATAQSNEPSEGELPEGKQTTLGLYVSARQAYEMWEVSPQRVKIIDVRTPEEYAFIGHPKQAWNIPIAFVTYHRKNGITEYGPKQNTEFVNEVKKIVESGDTLLLMCRSGARSAMAVNLLAEAGLEGLYNVTDGFEGDKVDDPDSVFHGKRMRNGWKNSAPWIYTVDPERIILEEGTSK